MQQRNARLIAGATAGAMILGGAALAGIAFTKAAPREPGGSRIVPQRVATSRISPEDPSGSLRGRVLETDGE